ncbi:Uncharacterized protein TCAP_05501 [Tolypocladium capitatum]|uniref:Uncharacterized protein n=1 Tax=Tolypocladium capitatum TaxID=45235 RepID=A0A2K3QAI1_9HYPO|nr:Uncharacterized protein TCAP_05501 [Tolypocladium capitatum]
MTDFLFADGPLSTFGEYSNAAVFEIMKQYLRQERPIPVVEAVRRILELMKHRGEPIVWKLFARLVLDVARKIPYRHVLQIHFIRLVTGIFYTLMTSSLQQCTGSLCAAFDDALKAEYTWFPPRRLSTSSPNAPNYHSNVNVYAFAARLTEAQILKIHTGFVATALETAIGRAIAGGVSPEERSARVSAAAMFIIYSGETIYARMLELRLEAQDDRYRYWRSGPSFPLADLSSWALWRAGFVDAAQSTALNGESRLLASKAAMLMSIIHQVRNWT